MYQLIVLSTLGFPDPLLDFDKDYLNVKKNTGKINQVHLEEVA